MPFLTILRDLSFAKEWCHQFNPFLCFFIFCFIVLNYDPSVPLVLNHTTTTKYNNPMHVVEEFTFREKHLPDAVTNPWSQSIVLRETRYNAYEWFPWICNFLEDEKLRNVSLKMSKAFWRRYFLLGSLYRNYFCLPQSIIHLCTLECFQVLFSVLIEVGLSWPIYPWRWALVQL